MRIDRKAFFIGAVVGLTLAIWLKTTDSFAERHYKKVHTEKLKSPLQIKWQHRPENHTNQKYNNSTSITKITLSISSAQDLNNIHIKLVSPKGAYKILPTIISIPRLKADQKSDHSITIEKIDPKLKDSVIAFARTPVGLAATAIWRSSDSESAQD